MIKFYHLILFTLLTTLLGHAKKIDTVESKNSSILTLPNTSIGYNLLTNNNPNLYKNLVIPGFYYNEKTASTSLKKLNSIELKFDKKDISCKGGSNGYITVNATGGTTPYAYSWTRDGSIVGSSTSTLTGLIAGTYTVTVTDANKNIETLDIIINEPKDALKALSAIQTNIACYGGDTGSATVAVSGGTPPYSYSWNNNTSTSATATKLTAGIYTVTVTDTNSCTTKYSFTITQPLPLSATISQTGVISCYNANDGILEVIATGGVAPYAYSWYPSNATTAKATNLIPGVHFVTITDANKCTITKNFTVTQPSPIEVPKVTDNQTFCKSQNATVANLQANGTAIKWYSTATATTELNSTDLLVSGTYYATQTVGKCESATRAEVTVTVIHAPTIITQPINSTICEGEDAIFTADVLNATNYTFHLSSDGGLTFKDFTTMSPNITLTNLDSSVQEYLFKYTVTNDCSSEKVTSNTAILTVNPLPVITTQPINNIICENENTTFTATASNATSYQWQVNQGSGFMDVNDIRYYSGATTPTLTITGVIPEMNGYAYRLIATGTCSPAAISNNVTLTVNSAPTIITQPSNLIICSGKNTSFTTVVSNATEYQWQVNQGSGFTNINNTGVYSGATTPTLSISEVITEMNGYEYRLIATGTCTAQAISNNARLSISNIALSISPTEISCYGESNGSIAVTASGGSAPYTYMWNDGFTSQNHTNLAPGTYTVRVTDANGCYAIQTYTITQPLPIAAPTVPTTQYFCSNQNATVANLQANGTAIKWYSSATATTELNVTDLLASGTYYATQSLNGCESATRAVVTVTLYNITAPVVATQTFCQAATVANLPQGNGTYMWYATPTGGSPLMGTTPLTSATYYVAEINTSCESSRTAVTVTIESNDLVKQKWNDVLVFNNTSNQYIAWQWYHEGQAISGATAQYYNAPQPLNGTYFVVATASNGTTIQTCPLTIALAKNTKALVLIPNPVQAGQILSIHTNYTDMELQGAKLIVTDITGKNIAYLTNPKTNTNIQAPNTAQIYIVTLILANGKQHTNKFIVQ